MMPARSWDRLSRSAAATRMSVLVVIRSPLPRGSCSASGVEQQPNDGWRYGAKAAGRQLSLSVGAG